MLKVRDPERTIRKRSMREKEHKRCIKIHREINRDKIGVEGISIIFRFRLEISNNYKIKRKV